MQLKWDIAKKKIIYQANSNNLEKLQHLMKTLKSETGYEDIPTFLQEFSSKEKKNSMLNDQVKQLTVKGL